MSVIKTKRFCGLLVSGYMRRIENTYSKTAENNLLQKVPHDLIVLCVSYYPASLAIHHSGYLANKQSNFFGAVIKNQQLRYLTLNHDLNQIQIINIFPQYQGCDHWVQTLKGELYTFDGHSLKYRSFPQFDKDDFAFMSTTFCAQKNRILILNNKQFIYLVTKQNKIYQLAITQKNHNLYEHSAKLFKSDLFNKYKVTNIQCGESHSLFLMENGKIVCYGSNEYGQCGIRVNKSSDIYKAQLVPGISDIIAISVGKASNLCLSKTGIPYGFGHNGHYQLGLGHNTQIVDAPTKLSCFEDKEMRLRQIKLGENHAAAITMDYKLFVWGQNNFGQTANPNYDDTENPSQIPQFEGIGIEHVECGSNHTVVTTRDNGEVWVFGHNQYNQCIPCSKHQLWKPVKLNRLDMDTTNNSYLMGIVAICDNTFILTDDTFI